MNPDNAARRIRRIDLRDSRARHLYSILLPSPLSFAHVTFVTHTRLFPPSSSSSSFSHSTVAASHSTREYFDIRLLRSPLPDRYDVSIIFCRAFERQTDANFNHFPLHCAASEVARCGNSNRDRCSRLCQHEVARNQPPWKEWGVAIRWNEATKDEGKMDWSEGGGQTEISNPKAGIRRVATTANVNVCPSPLFQDRRGKSTAILPSRLDSPLLFFPFSPS